MNKDNEPWRIEWTQAYPNWLAPQPIKQVEPQPEPELMNLSEARAVLARIMSK